MPSQRNPDRRAGRPKGKGHAGPGKTARSNPRRVGEGHDTSERWPPGRFEAAETVLGAVLSFSQPADAVLSSFFRANRHLGQRDRSLIADAVYDILRHRRWLEQLCMEPTPRRMLLAAIIKMGGLSLGALTQLTRPEEVEWLKGLRAADAAQADAAVRVDLPDWIFTRLSTQFGSDDLAALGRSLQANAPLDLRVNSLKTNRKDALEALRAAGFQCEPTPYSVHGIRLAGKPAINLHPLFLDGSVEVQDEGSQLIAQLVAPRRQDLVVDFCAGAGGKTLALGAAMDSHGRLYAFDISDRRLANLRPRLKRSGLSNVFPQRITGVRDSHVKRLAGKADRLLLDVPCSGLGTLRRNPDLKWRTQESAIAEMVAKQAEILKFASALLKPGGRLVYATCSLLREENEDVIKGFLAEHADFQMINAAEVLAHAKIPLDTGEYLRLRPDLHGTDGFFAAVLQRTPA